MVYFKQPTVCDELSHVMMEMVSKTTDVIVVVKSQRMESVEMQMDYQYMM